jgi:hypothetical protein
MVVNEYHTYFISMTKGIEISFFQKLKCTNVTIACSVFFVYILAIKIKSSVEIELLVILTSPYEK